MQALKGMIAFNRNGERVLRSRERRLDSDLSRIPFDYVSDLKAITMGSIRARPKGNLASSASFIFFAA